MRAFAINGSPRKRLTRCKVGRRSRGAGVPSRKRLGRSLALPKWEISGPAGNGSPRQRGNMKDPGRTIAWLGAAIHRHAGSRPPADLRE